MFDLAGSSFLYALPTDAYFVLISLDIKYWRVVISH
jgi:hypothetical protein